MCFIINGKWFCICKFDFFGLVCLECLNFICYNGGFCVMLIDERLFCVCDIYFGGIYCEKSINLCLFNFCFFGCCDIMMLVDIIRV